MSRLTPLTRYGRDVSSVFDLLGRNENDLTAAFGFALARSPGLLRRVARRLAPEARLSASDGREAKVRSGNQGLDLHGQVCRRAVGRRLGRGC